MRRDNPRIGLALLCGWFGITRQAYYQNNVNELETSLKEELILAEVKNIRKSHPRMGTVKLLGKLEEFKSQHRLKVGRDALFDLLAANNLLVKKRKRNAKTTNSFHWLRKYPNLIKDYMPQAPNRLWVSDITYWRIASGRFVYISLITDAYSHKIVGYHVANTLESIETLQALQMAIKQTEGLKSGQLVHHSDRGVQYCSHNYVDVLQKHGISISMTENGDPYENATAERVNGILKDEYLFSYQVDCISQAAEKLAQAVKLYNQERPHNSIENLCPEFVHSQGTVTKRLWKNYKPERTAKQTIT